MAESKDITEQLKQLGAELQAVGEDKEQQAEKIKQVEELLGNLQVKDFPDLAESPVVQSFLGLLRGDMRPGEVKHKGTLAEVDREWTLEDINAEIRAERMGLKKFTPMESLPLTFNGVQIYVRAGEECEIPDCFYNIYKDHMYAKKQAGINERFLQGESNAEPDPNWSSESGALVRAYSTQGEQYGRKNRIAYGPLKAVEGE